ncbi:hypothetical protein GCM10009865_11680 [Aeromicrobium ponti]|uniref:Mn-containing catalase n=1 Tax=Cytobacillus oceanisediminis TaxID=665099 RepID=A0A562K302_9BACI|nr:manganese catalase family protein [Cytobacillus oceanisediminis]TWH89798.1 Mn-containing catalase [Cytobacillus oceanisediminis]
MLQNQWLAAIKELDVQEGKTVLSIFSKELEKEEFSYVFMNLSRGEESSQGCWASGRSMDGQGTFQYLQEVPPFASAPKLKPAPPYIHDAPPNVK